MKNLTVTYRKFDHLSEFTDAQLKKLRKLSYGNNGCMAPVIDVHNNGYVSITTEGWKRLADPADCIRYDKAERKYKLEIDADAFGLNRHIMVAYVGNKMVGWTVTDLEKMFNVYVAKNYRNLGIAQKLTELWAERNKALLSKYADKGNSWDDPLFSVVHTTEAAKLMKNAMRKLGINGKKAKKFRKVTHKVIG